MTDGNPFPNCLVTHDDPPLIIRAIDPCKGWDDEIAFPVPTPHLWGVAEQESSNTGEAIAANDDDFIPLDESSWVHFIPLTRRSTRLCASLTCCAVIIFPNPTEALRISAAQLSMASG